VGIEMILGDDWERIACEGGALIGPGCVWCVMEEGRVGKSERLQREV